MSWRGRGFDGAGLMHARDTAYDKELNINKTPGRIAEEYVKRERSFVAKAAVELPKLGNKGFSKEECRKYLRGIYDDIMDGWDIGMFGDADVYYNRVFNECYKTYISDKRFTLLDGARDDGTGAKSYANRSVKNKNPKAKEHRW